MDQKLLIVVSIISARNFPRRSDCSILIEAQLNGEVLTSDPTPHSSGVVQISTELAFEMTRKAFQQHKLHRTPIKLVVFAVDSSTNARQKVGYVMLDLRSVRISSQSDPAWYGVLNLNSTYSRLKPQLQVEVSVEEEGVGLTEVQGQRQHTDPLTNTVPISLTLDPSGDYYILGTPSKDHRMYTLSLTLHNAQHLPRLPNHLSQFYFYYSLLGNDITSELFAPPTFSAERASIRINSRKELLSLLFAAQQEVEVHLCCGTDSLAKGSLSLSGLGSRDVLNCTIPLGNSRDGPTVDVTVQLEQTNVISTPHTITPSSQVPPSTKATPTPTPNKDKVTTLPSAKRNLTPSFEEASQPTPSHSSVSAGISSSTQSTPTQPSPTIAAPPTFSRESPPTKIVHQPIDTFTTGTKTNTLPSKPVAVSNIAKTTPSASTVTTNVTGSGHTLSGSGTVTRPPSFPVVGLGPAGQEAPHLAPDHNTVGQHPGLVDHRVNSDSFPQHPTGSQSPKQPHHFRFSVDLRSIHNLQLESQRKCYLRYSYPFFGSSHPVLIQPPVLPTIGVDQQFSHSFCSFDFVVWSGQLKQHVTQHPLTVEVWQPCDQSPDQIVGLAQVLLGSVLSHERAGAENGTTRQVCSLRVPITPPPSSSSHPHTVTLGYLNAVLILEDFGVMHEEAKKTDSMNPLRGGDVASGLTNRLTSDGKGQPLVGSQEYNTAMELEMWKLTQQEVFEEQLKAREAAHMAKLGDELQRRESQRQALLKQKLDHYTSLETQLKDGLQQLQSQQRAVTEREAKLSQEWERLSREKLMLQDEMQRSQSQLRSQYEQQIEIERLKSSELQLLVNSLKKQVHDLEVRVQSREAEFESYRQQMLARPESKLHAELSILQLEKAELDRKLGSLAKSKQHYKEQWTRALAELASCRQKEQAAARERLLTQQRELEAMRMQYIENEHQNSLKQQLTQVKNEVEKLQQHTLANPHLQDPPSAPHTATPPPSTSNGNGFIHPPESSEKVLDPNVARWIEERDILLQTGVYSSSDVTIQKLDSKIRQALQQHTTQ